jgi:hypothetical protein
MFKSEIRKAFPAPGVQLRQRVHRPRVDVDFLLTQRESALKTRLEKHAHEKHSEKSKRYYVAGYEAAWSDLIGVLKANGHAR